MATDPKRLEMAIEVARKAGVEADEIKRAEASLAQAKEVAAKEVAEAKAAVEADNANVAATLMKTVVVAALTEVEREEVEAEAKAKAEALPEARMSARQPAEHMARRRASQQLNEAMPWLLGTAGTSLLAPPL